MSCITVVEANKRIPKAENKITFIKDGNTQDIINTILKEDKRGHNYTHEFAKSLRGATVYNTCRNIWHFVKCNIHYKLDPFGEQYIKTPAQTWQDRFADCKSMSLFIGSILKNLNLPYIYRFVGYGKSTEIKHVYVVVPHNNSELIIDACMPAFNKEKEYNKKSKKDYKMSKIYVVQGIGTAQPGRLVLPKAVDELSDAELDLLIAKQGLEIDKMNAERVAGIGSFEANDIDKQLSTVNQMLSIVSNDHLTPDEKIRAVQSIGCPHDISGIGRLRLGKILKNTIKKVGNTVKSTAKKVGQDLKKTVNAIKKNPLKIFTAPVTFGIKTAINTTKGATGVAVTTTKGATQLAVATTKAAVTAPLRLMAKTILEIQLPAAAPMFLYLFVNDQDTINKLPEKARAKRKKSERLANFIVNEVGMKREHFMGIVRNGIKKRYGKEPEQVIAEGLKSPVPKTDNSQAFDEQFYLSKYPDVAAAVQKGQFSSGYDHYIKYGKNEGRKPNSISAIGVAPIIMAIIGAVTAIINLIAKNKKKKHEDKLTESDVPDPSTDFGSSKTVSPSSSSPVQNMVKREVLAKEIEQGGTTTDNNDYQEASAGGGNNKTLLLVGGAGLLAVGYFLTQGKKRK